MQGVGVCGIGSGLCHGWGYVAGVGHVAWCGGMWLGVGSCDKVWGHVAGSGGLSQGIGAYGRGRGGDM